MEINVSIRKLFRAFFPDTAKLRLIDGILLNSLTAVKYLKDKVNMIFKRNTQ